MSAGADLRPRELEALAARLEARIASGGSAIVAFSGGVDSSLVLALAARALGDRALAVTATSPAVPREELSGARTVADQLGVAHEVIDTDELANAAYRSNDRFRCFHCKTELYGQLSALALRRGFKTVLSGANLDDAGDWRPGLRAAAEHGVRHPLMDEQVDKTTVRALAAQLGVPTAAKPASPCLASRIPYGTPVDAATLGRIEVAERAVRQLGLRSFRVRHHGDLGRVEVAADELDRALDPRRRRLLEAAVRSAGYRRAEVSTQPLRSGSLNDAVLKIVTADAR
jgi:uncharacterized protein